MFHQQEQTVQSQTRSLVQKEFPELAMKDQRGLPTDLYRDRFSFDKERDPELTTAMRALNWSTSHGQNPLIVTGPAGIGKSTLSWQIMNEADNRGLVPIMISAADLATGRNFEKVASDGRPLPLSSVRDLVSVMEKLEGLKERSLRYGTSVVMIVDGIDPDHYNPQHQAACNQLLRAVRSHGLPVILNIESERNITRGGSLEGYFSILNPRETATGALLLRRDNQAGLVMNHESVKFRS